jgi:putative ABC transport system permease protein
MPLAGRKRKFRFEPHVWLIHAMSLLVPRRLRDDWKREWKAELRHREDRLRQWQRRNASAEYDLLKRSSGSFWDALWLQSQRLEDDMFQDVRFGVRMLLKDSIFTSVAILTLALGIGANTAIFSVVNAVLLRPLPFANPERLVSIWETHLTRGTAGPGASPPDFREWRDRTHSFEQMTAFADRYFNLSDAGEPERLPGGIVSADFFSTLGTTMAVGRGFYPAEEQYGAHLVVVLSHGLWQRRFGADPAVVGRAINLNDQQYTIAGVAPPDFRFPDARTQLWTPMAFAPEDRFNTRGNHFLGVVARLRPGMTPEQAQADLNIVTAQLEQEHKENAGIGTKVIPLREDVVGDYRSALLVLLGAVSLVLLIACTNVASLLLARAASRQKEFALRAALGASRLRMIRQLLTESMLLSAMGGSIGLLLAVGGVKALIALGPADLPRASEIGVDGHALAVTLAVSIVTGLIFGLAPALQAVRLDLTGALKEGGRTLAGGARTRRTRSALVVTELALSLVLLVGAGLLIGSFLRLQRVDVGFDPGSVLTLQLALSESKYPLTEPGPAQTFYRQLSEEVAALPGVRAVGATTSLPLAPGGWGKLVTVEDRPVPTAIDAIPVVQYRQISAGYFGALGVALVKGRVFTERDDENSPKVAVINETMAERFWPNEDPVGKRMFMGPPEALLPAGALPAGYSFPRLTVVGVVADVKHRGLSRAPDPEVYIPHLQGATETARNMYMAVRTTTDPMTLAAAVRGRVADLDKDQPVADMQTMEQRLAESLSPARFNMLLIGVFAAVALVLAAVGLYGLMAYSVAQRTQEIGIRVAVGAQAGDVLRLIVGQGMRLALVGIGVGLLAALAFTRVLSGLLFGVSATDPATFAAVAALLAGVALVACFIPANRALRVNPAIVLRNE